jgi:O-antigen ligase
MGQVLGIFDSRHALFSITGTFLNPGPYGGFLAVIGVIVILHASSNYSLFVGCKQRDGQCGIMTILFRSSCYLSLVASILIIIMLVLSGSRSAVLGFVIPVAMYVLTMKRIQIKINSLRCKRSLISTGLLFVIIILLLGYFIRPESVKGRLHIWQVSLCEFNGSVVIGKGIGTFSKQYSIAQEKFYLKNGFESNWIKYADTPNYAFNEYLNIIFEIGVIGLFFFSFILYFIIKKQILCNKNRVFTFGVISILIISFTSYSLHLIPISIILVVLLSIREETVKVIIPWEYTLLMLSVMFFFTVLRLPNYLATVNATTRWKNIKMHSDMSIIEIRNENDFLDIYDLLKNNDGFLLDYAIFLKNGRDYSRSIDILKKGHIISNNAEFPLLLAEINAVLGSEHAVELYYKKAFSMIPNRLSPLYLLAVFYYDTGQYAKFRCLANRIADFSPKIRSVRTDRMKRDIIDLLHILNED